MHRLIIFNFLFIIFVSTTHAQQQENKWVLNKDHSTIEFNIKYMSIATTKGFFTDFSGSFLYDSDEKDLKDISILIKPASITTLNTLRDGHLKGKDFLDIDQFSEISFKSELVRPVAPDTWEVSGELKFKDKKIKTLFNAQLSSINRDSWGKQNLYIFFKGSLSRSDLGITWNKKINSKEYLLGDFININGTFQAQRQNKMTPSSHHMIPVNKSTETRSKRSQETGSVKQDNDLHVKPNFDASVVRARDDQLGDKKHKRKTSDANSKGGIHILAYLLVSSFSILFSIVISIKIKSLILSKIKEKYNEVGLWGYLGDTISIIILSANSYAIWLLGNLL